MSLGIKHGAAADELGINSDKEALVALTQTIEKAGYAIVASEQDEGTISGTRRVIASETDDDFRQRVAMATLLFNRTFTGSALHTGVWFTSVLTMTATVASGWLTLNAGASIAGTTYAQVRSYQSFPIFGVLKTYVEFNAQFTLAPVTNNLCEIGLGYALTNASPTDGVFLRLLSNGEFRLISNVNGTEVQSDPIDFNAWVGAATTRSFILAVDNKSVQLWIDNKLAEEIPLPVGGTLLTASSQVPFFARTINPAPTGTAQQIKLSLVNITVEGGDYLKDDIVVLGGFTALQGQEGETMGSTARITNSANPTAAVPTNTTAALGTGLGGEFWETDTLAVTTDGIISSYLNTAGTSLIPGKTLLVSAVKIESFVQTTLTGGGYNAVWSLAFGHNAVSLANPEAAATKAPRRVSLGTQAVASGATALTALPIIDVTFDPPIPVNSGEYIQTVKKKVGTAPSAGVIAHVITINGRKV